MTYLITFSCYGNHIHGDESGSVDLVHHIYLSPLAPEDPERAHIERAHLKDQPYSIQPKQRKIVLQAIREVCLNRGWTLHVVHVRTTQVHVVAEGDLRPEAMMNTLKAYASRALNRSGIDGGAKPRWARHGSTRWLWGKDHVDAAVEYVTKGQGEPMAVYLAEWIVDRANTTAP